jgi:hypothetical protein
MLRENTGRSILDSGDYYGRHWQRNQGADFEAQQEGNLEFWPEPLVTLSVYHWLKSRVEYNSELDNQYREYCEAQDEALWLRSAESFARSIDGKGIYGDDSGPLTVNTYNGEDLLSQTLQYVYWTDEEGAHVLLQIHGGCDVRGGYTDPVAFDLIDETSIFDNARATIYCEDCGKHWDTDNGSHWAPDGCYGQGYTQLQEYPATDERPEYPRLNPAQLLLPIDLPDRPEPCAGVVWIDEDRNGHCPYCGGLLNVAPFPC